MRCKTTQAKLSAHLDGELEPEAAQRVREHLEQCPDCARLAEEVRALDLLLDGVPGATAPEGFARSVRQEAVRLRAQRRPRLIPFPTKRIPALTGVAAMLAVVIGLTLGGWMSRSVSRAKAGASQPRDDGASEVLLSAVPPGSVAESYLEWTGEGQ